MSNASNLSTLANVLDDGSDGQFLKSTGSGGVAFDTVAAGAVVYATADLLPLSGNSAGDMAYVTATNRFYINNGSGWYSVSLVNTNPNITSVQDASSNTTPFTLATDGTATVVTVTAADPEDVPLTYGYSVTTGDASLNGSTVVQGTGSNSNVFTVTPHASQDATFTITFTASDGINQATSANAFSLSFITIVADSNHTTLLATATGTSDNNNITDSSSNSHSITVNGDAHAGTFSPYRSGGYSTYFDGSGDHFIFVDSSLAEGTGDFTLECWFYLTANLQQNHTIFGHGATPGYQICAGNVNEIGFMKDGTNRLLKTATLNLNQWYHIVYQRASGTLYGFLDGVSLGTISMTDDFTNTGIEVGVNRGGTEYFEGYIRDVRIVKGTTIYNTSETTFTPPTETLTAVSGSGYSTTLLTCHKPYIVDGGANSLEPTISGDPETKPFSPYDYNEYSATDHGGSVYFDGNGDYLLTPTSSDFTYGTGDFTIECWVYIPSHPSNYSYLFAQGNSTSNTNSFGVYIQNGVFKMWNGANILTGTTSYSLNTWTHLSLSRSGSNLKFFIDGAQEGSTITNTSNISTGSSAGIEIARWVGVGDGAHFNGYITDFRVVKGTSVYSSNFTPPTAPLSSSGASLHIKGTDASIIDKSQGSNLKLVGNTTGSTTQVKFANTKSMYFDGIGDYASLNETYDEFLESGTVGTIEWWGRLTSRSPRGTIIGNWLSNNGWTIDYDTSHKIHITRNSSTSNFGTTNLSFNVWHHYAVVNSGTGLACYINGTQIGTLTNFTVGANSSGAMRIGQRNDGSLSSQGYIQDLRITKGLARYTAADETSNIPTAPLEG